MTSSGVAGRGFRIAAAYASRLRSTRRVPLTIATTNASLSPTKTSVFRIWSSGTLKARAASGTVGTGAPGETKLASIPCSLRNALKWRGASSSGPISRPGGDDERHSKQCRVVTSEHRCDCETSYPGP